MPKTIWFNASPAPSLRLSSSDRLLFLPKGRDGAIPSRDKSLSSSSTPFGFWLGGFHGSVCRLPSQFLSLCQHHRAVVPEKTRDSQAVVVITSAATTTTAVQVRLWRHLRLRVRGGERQRGEAEAEEKSILILCCLAENKSSPSHKRTEKENLRVERYFF